MDKPYDYFVTRAWEAIVGTRRTAHSHVDLAIPALEADFTAEPGAALAKFTGIMGDAAAEALVVGESETGYLTADELVTARVKFHVYLRQRLIEGKTVAREANPETEERANARADEKKHGEALHDRIQDADGLAEAPSEADEDTKRTVAAYPDDACLLVVAERVTEEVIARGLPGVVVTRPEPGLWVSSPGFRMYIVSTQQLAFRDETAALHLLCRGPHMARALRGLVLHEDPEASECGRHLSEVVEAMHTTSPRAHLT